MRQKEADLSKLVWEARRYYHEEARAHLPWRATRDPYKILVSEVMLQQTQVERVIPKYREFLRRYPTLERLARARPAAVRRTWYPLGYNIRPRHLQGIARETLARLGEGVAELITRRAVRKTADKEFACHELRETILNYCSS